MRVRLRRMGMPQESTPNLEDKPSCNAMRTALLPVLALAVLPACRTVQTVALAPSLEEAVVAANGHNATVTFAGGQRVRPASLVLRDSTLVYTLPGSETRYERPAREVVQIVRDVSRPAAGLIGYGLVGAGEGIAWGAYFQLTPRRSRTYEGFANAVLLGIGAGLVVNYAVNPRRVRVIYRAAHPPEP